MNVAEAVRAAADKHRPYVPPEITFWDYLAATTNFKLDPWQFLFSWLLNSLLHTEGRRILVHAMPQIGKSILKSKRFPAYFLGMRPTNKVVLAGFNITHTTNQFAEQVRNVMQSPEHRAIFNDPRTWIPDVCAAGEFSTKVRQRAFDGQESLTALGLQTGFVGKGVHRGDILLIDDPYATPEDALSKAVNDKTNRFWTENADNRVDEKANVVATFHRYQPDDFAGRRLAEGGWEYYRFPAVADNNEDGSDPTRACCLALREFYELNPEFPFREEGELLSSRSMCSPTRIERIKKTQPLVYWSQYQGQPRHAGGTIFERHWLKRCSECPPIKMWVRFWDLTASEAKSTDDWISGALVGIGPDHTVYIRDVVRFKEQWPAACEIIELTTKADRDWAKAEGYEYVVGVEKVFWQLAMVQDLFTKGIFDVDNPGCVQLHPVAPEGDKKQRASGLAARAKFDKLRLYDPTGTAQWVLDFIEEACGFDGRELTNDDQIDAASGAYLLLWVLKGELKNDEKAPIPGSRDYYEALKQNYADREARARDTFTDWPDE